MGKILVILGPTATGKTDLALSQANQFNGEIISCDSRQVYIGLDIGTGKSPTDPNLKIIKGQGFWEIDGMKIWLLDLVFPETQFTVKEYVELAQEKIKNLHNQKKLPIIVGGTGFYLKALLEGIDYLEIPIDQKLREELSKLDLDKLQTKLQEKDLEKWNNLNNSEKNNKRRLIRILEIIYMNPYINNYKQSEIIEKYQVLKIGLTAPRPILNQRIDDRLDLRIVSGLIEEGKNLIKNGLTINRMKELGLEYKYLAMFLDGKLDEKQFIETLKTKIHQYAKRQMTWFKRDKDINWFDVTEFDYQSKLVNLVRSWYDPVNE